MSILIARRPLFFQLTREQLGIFIVYLFHVSALIGISLGYFDWFVEKTPLNLSLMCVLTYFVMKPSKLKHHFVLFLIFLIGMSVEILGVQYGMFFGSYSYGENLGLKVLSVPLLIGANWALLTWVTAIISNHIFKNTYFRVLTGSVLMLLLDFLMEPAAPIMDFWTFDGGHAPLSNYVAWFAIAVIMHTLIQVSGIEGRRHFSMHYYLIQLVFFGGILICS